MVSKRVEEALGCMRKVDDSGCGSNRVLVVFVLMQKYIPAQRSDHKATSKLTGKNT